MNIIPEERQSINCFDGKISEECYAWRFLIKNKKSMDWLPLRETATNCQAKIEVFKEEKKLFNMKGRWANSAQISHIAQQDQFKTILYPDPISIRSGKDETLDGIVQFLGERIAYGWNNEAYSNNWRTPAYMLEKGHYRVVVTVSPQNGHEVSEEFKLSVSESFNESSLMSK